MVKIFKINLYKTIKYKLKKKNIIIFKKMYTNIRKDAKLIVKNVLILGQPHSKLYEGQFVMRKGSYCEVTGNFAINTGCKICLEENAILKIGSGFINNDSSINCRYKITIGNNVAISNNVKIKDTDTHQIIYNGVKQEINKEVIIEDNVWIGENAIILKGVKIGKGAIIGAGSIVTHDIPENCIAAGNPARVIKDNIKWEL